MEEKSEFGVSVEQLRDVVVSRSFAETKIAELGGTDSIASALESSLKHGLTAADEQQGFSNRKRVFGSNIYPQKAMKWLFQYFFGTLQDPLLIVLMVLAIISIFLGLAFPEREEDRKYGWIEGAAIIIAVLIVATVTSFNDWSKERKFRQLNKSNAEINIKVIRDSKDREILITDLMVGDVVKLDTGDAIPADGILFEGFDLKVDESTMTGETEPVKKNPKDSPVVLSGTFVNNGCGRMLVIAVGFNSEWGITLLELTKDDDEDNETPLESKLDKLAEFIGKIGVGFALTTVIVMIAVYLCKKFILINMGLDYWSWTTFLTETVKFIVIGVTVVVVAVPEGLPLAVTISLAYSVAKMMKDKNLVKQLAACETMGGCTNICSDKTGTLTLNQMRVTKCWVGGTKYFNDNLPKQSTLNEAILKPLTVGISVNSTARLAENKEDVRGFKVVGNSTEGALLIFSTVELETNYHNIRKDYEDREAIKKIYTFSSVTKRMSSIVCGEDNTHTLYTKGASEIVLKLCNRYVNNEGIVVPMSETMSKEVEEEVIQSMADEGLRTLCLAYRPVTEPVDQWENQADMETNLICLGIVGIKDPVRKEVPAAVQSCKSAGIIVRMVTGDNILTAKFIARECDILNDQGIAMEGPIFEQEVEDDRAGFSRDKLPYLQVLARSQPRHKKILVELLRDQGEVVAVTGDGTNDAMALKTADVGLAMGIQGTQVAKEAADIIIMDDNFSSIVKSVLWGRSVFENIRKFLQFQITVNVVALLLTVTTAFTSFIPPAVFLPADERSTRTHLEPPLTAVQLLWVNLIMDTFAALALATEPPVQTLLDRKPYGRYESLITPSMWINILVQGLYQLLVLLVLYYAGIPMGLASGDDKFSQNNTFVFNAFVFCQIFNEINCRKINNELNIFARIHLSIPFILIFIGTMAAQVGIVFLGGRFTQTVHLSWPQWVVSIGLGVLSIPLSLLTRVVTRFLQSKGIVPTQK